MNQISEEVNPKDFLQPYKCGSCNKAFPDENLLKFHLIQRICISTSSSTYQNGDPEIEAKTKSEEGSSKCGLKNHNTQIHEPTHEAKIVNQEAKLEVSIKCHLCDKSFSSKLGMSLHLRRVHEKEKNFSCATCGKTFFDMTDYRRHSNTHQSKKLYNCDFCGKGFSQQIGLKVHKTTHLGKGNYQCNLCNKTFHTKSGLDNHKQSIHDKTTYKCDRCNKIFKSSNNLKYHIKYVHEKLKKFKCHLCQYDSARNEDLKIHISGVHGKMKKFKCDFCDHSFNLNHRLNIHMRAVHFGEKDKCKYCKELFSPTHILEHQKKCTANENYHGEKFKCNICDSDKRYASEKSLKIHQRLVHRATKKTYPCNSCEKSFATESIANKHIKDVHIREEDYVNCTFCYKSMKPFSLKYHLKTCTSQKSKEEKLECKNCHLMLSLDHLNRRHSKFCVMK